MLLLLGLAPAISVAPPAEARAATTATVRIERPVAVGGEQWERLPRSSRSEIVVRDEQGRPVLVRVVELQ
jgi:hypothetical protein